LEPISSSGCRIPVATGGVSHGAGEEDGETDTGSTGAGEVGTPTRTRAESGPEPAEEAGLPHDLQNLAPGFNCEPQCRHCSLACPAARVSGVAHFQQNFAPGPTRTPHEGQRSTGIAGLGGRGAAEPHRPQNLPDTSALHVGHSMLPSFAKNSFPPVNLVS
jgi:hypothetical protein